jgi:hypothetical protein
MFLGSGEMLGSRRKVFRKQEKWDIGIIIIIVPFD